MDREKPPAIFWEHVDSESQTVLERAKIPGGWLYRCRLVREYWDKAIQAENQETLGVSIAFVPDVARAGGES